MPTFQRKCKAEPNRTSNIAYFRWVAGYMEWLGQTWKAHLEGGEKTSSQHDSFPSSDWHLIDFPQTSEEQKIRKENATSCKESFATTENAKNMEAGQLQQASALDASLPVSKANEQQASNKTRKLETKEEVPLENASVANQLHNAQASVAPDAFGVNDQKGEQSPARFLTKEDMERMRREMKEKNLQKAKTLHANLPVGKASEQQASWTKRNTERMRIDAKEVSLPAADVLRQNAEVARKFHRAKDARDGAAAGRAESVSTTFATAPSFDSCAKASQMITMLPATTGQNGKEPRLLTGTEGSPAPQEALKTSESGVSRQAQLQITGLESQNRSAQDKISQLSEMLAGEQAKRQTAEGERTALQSRLTATLQETAKLKVQLQIQKRLSSFIPGAKWQFDSDGHWEAFTPDANEKMQEAYLEYLEKVPGSRNATITSGGVLRMVDFELMEQTHLGTHKVRSIRISADVPDQWVTPVADLLQQSNDLRSFYKQVTDHDVWDSICHILQNSGHAWDTKKQCSCMRRAEIKSVHRIENMRLWQQYKMRLAAMRQDHATHGISVGSADLDLDGNGNAMAGVQKTLDCGEELAQDVDEKILLHGTSWDNANSIVQEGFDPRTCQTAMYGAGVYFACAACKSHQYTCDNHKKCCPCSCERTLIIARVALGDSVVAKETRQRVRRPPLREGSSSTYDSVVVKPGPIKDHPQGDQVHQEYVIFDTKQAYPCFVVQYTI